MDAPGFDALTRALVTTGTRRRALRAGLVAALGLAGGPLGVQGAAACRARGETCRRGSQCCSGLCRGPRGRKTCRRAPLQGTCTIASSVCAGTLTPCGNDNGFDCLCRVTARGTAFCGSLETGACIACGSNADCEQARPGSGWVCTRCATCPDTGNRACIAPCPDPDRPARRTPDGR